MQCGEGAYEANCDGGGCGYVVSIGNDGGGGKEKKTHHIHTTNTTNITSTTVQLDKLLLIKAATLTTAVTVATSPRIQHSPIIHLSIALLQQSHLPPYNSPHHPHQPLH